jgi:hypothetical protein
MRYVNVNNVWKNSIQYAHSNSSWKRVRDVHGNVNGVWKSTIPPIGTFIEGGYVAGIIDTVDADGERYLLLVSPKVNEANLQWSTTTGVGSTVISKWNGLENTIALATTQFPAAKYCADVVINGYSDWYLPAIDELELVYRNLKPTNLINEMNFKNDQVTRSKSYVYPSQDHGYNPSSDPVGLSYINVPNAAIDYRTQHLNSPITGIWPNMISTVALPSKTTIPIFQEDQSESFWPPRNLMEQRFAYLSSTYYTSQYAFRTFFYTCGCGNQWAKSGGQYKDQYGTNAEYHYVRPVRRILI